MSDQMSIFINPKMWLEIDYVFYPSEPSNHYDVPPDAEDLEVKQVRLCTHKCEIDVTYMMDDLQPLMSIESIIDKVSNHIHE